MNNKIRIAIFSGGRGTSTICEELVRYPEVELSILVNAYDDGLSTGYVRRYIPGMLGPSDVRKNLSRMLDDCDKSSRALQFLLEYRLPLQTDYARGMDILSAIAGMRLGNPDALIAEHYGQLNIETAMVLSELIGLFMAYAQDNKASRGEFEFPDCSVGNIIFSGAFLSQGRDFNRAIAYLELHFKPRARILNVTRGENLVLTGLKTDGTYLHDEAAIVSKQSAVVIKDIFLLDGYLSEAEEQQLQAMAAEQKEACLRGRNVTPKISPEADAALRGADIIIYGPGTQHSSLFPSYMTLGVGAAIADNANADKVFICNIRKDHEIQGEDINSLATKLFYYLNLQGSCSYGLKSLLSTFFVQIVTEEDGIPEGDSYLSFSDNFDYKNVQLVTSNWESRKGVHHGGVVIKEIFSIVNERLSSKISPLSYMVSIIVPALNEARTIKNVLHSLILLNLHDLGVDKEIIFVDGGSDDGTMELARQERGVRCFQLKGAGRGDAIRHGIAQARGNIVVFFHSDGEYDEKDLIPAVKGIMKDTSRIIFGSRAIKCLDFSRQIKDIYEGHYMDYLISKYGGFTLSFLSLLFYNRFVSDPLTGIKAFDAKTLQRLQLRLSGLDLETEIIAKAGRIGEFILEFPVSYRPRKKQEGKKTTLMDGIKAIACLFRERFNA